MPVEREVELKHRQKAKVNSILDWAQFIDSKIELLFEVSRLGIALGTDLLTLKVSKKNILTVESIKATATNLLLGLILTSSTPSSNSSVLV